MSIYEGMQFIIKYVIGTDCAFCAIFMPFSLLATMNSFNLRQCFMQSSNQFGLLCCHDSMCYIYPGLLYFNKFRSNVLSYCVRYFTLGIYFNSMYISACDACN